MKHNLRMAFLSLLLVLTLGVMPCSPNLPTMPWTGRTASAAATART